MDNPLIVHVDGLKMARTLVEFTDAAEKLAASFWPGPLTVVLPSRGVVPDAVTAGLSTVGVRMPDNDAAAFAHLGCGRAHRGAERQ